MTYSERLSTLKQELPLPFAPGSDEESAALDRFRAFFSDFSPAKVEQLLGATYAEDIWFNDTLKTVEGIEPLGQYLSHSASAVDACVVDVAEISTNGKGDYYARWSMMIQFKRFKRGQQTHSIGMSHLRFNEHGKVVLHQDYWDSSQGLFEHVPVLGAMIRWIKRRA